MVIDRLREFYDILQAESDLRRLVADREAEDIHVEFKKKKDSRTPELDRHSDGWQFSRALSGFANSDGGVLIWGIDTDREDRACGLVPIAQHREFLSRLKKSMLNAVQPMVQGIEIEPIDCDADAACGYVKCLIPVSDRTPHRAMLADREY